MTFPFPFNGRTHTLTTFDPLQKAAAIVLSNGNLTATASAAGIESVRVSRGFSQGIRYGEVAPTTIGVGGTFVGIGTASASLTSFPGGDANGHGYYSADGHRYTGGSDIGVYGASYTNANVIGILLNMNTPSVTFYKDGVVAAGGAITIVAGTWFVMVGDGGSGTVTNVWTFNGGDSAFIGALPANASKWND